MRNNQHRFNTTSDDVAVENIASVKMTNHHTCWDDQTPRTASNLSLTILLFEVQIFNSAVALQPQVTTTVAHCAH